MEIRLLFDSGNSQLKWVMLLRKHRGADLLATSDRTDVKDLLNNNEKCSLKNLILKSLKNLKQNLPNEINLEQMQKAATVHIASVAPKALNQVISSELAGIFPQQNISFIWTKDNHEIITGPNHRLVFKINRKNPRSLGVDRWLAMIGLREYLEKKKINTVFILSAGTATVLDKISIKKNERDIHTQEIIHEGGYIIPGFSLMENSLEFLTTRVETKKYKPLDFPSGTNDSVLSGIFIVQAAISFITESTAPIFLYGGNIDKFLAALSLTQKLIQRDCNVIVDPWLVFKGLNQLAKR